MRAEGQASGSPQDPDFETVGSFPLTVNDPATTDRVAAAFATHFGDHALEIDRQTVSEDFSNIPNAAGVPYTYWAMGFTDAGPVDGSPPGPAGGPWYSDRSTCS